MYLKSLELQGFKSFPDKTKLSFEKGATVIVGPNGSGKSNISDAMRWVLGEISSKSIRGTKMEDIIFGGADSRKPMGFAEVSVTFDNEGDEGGHLDSPYDEVTVTRRYYRAGDSEYFINRKPVRLKDIYELFMNTGIGRDGYSIIGQGKIAEIISQKSDERRSIFEDASGIAKYRHRKSEAERKLSATEDNMLRINDILSELEGRVEPLEKESAKAKKYLELYENKKKADVELWIFDTEKLRTDLENAERSFKISELELQNAEDSIRALEVQDSKLFEAAQSNKMESEELLGKISEQTKLSHDLDSEYRLCENDTEHLRMLAKTSAENITVLEKNIESENESKKSRRVHISELEKALDETKKQYEETTARQNEASDSAEKLEFDIAKALDDIKQLESERVDVKVRRSILENAKDTDKDKNESIASEIEDYRRKSEELKKKCENAEKSVRKYLDEIDKIDAEESEAEKKGASLAARRRDESEILGRLRVKSDSLAQRIENLRRMEEHFEGYNNSVRFVMKQYESGNIRSGKIYGPLSKLISVDGKFVTAIETSLGANLQNIVVENEDTAKAAIYSLKNAGAGRATFYPLTSMKASPATQEVRDAAAFRGYIGTADSLVKHDPRFKDIVSSLLGRTVVFDNIENASDMAKSLKYRVRTVTLDGQQINQGGSFTGGSAKRDSGILSRGSEIESLSAELKIARADTEKASARLAETNRALKISEDAIASLAERRKLIQTMMNAENSEYDKLNANLSANESLINKLAIDIETLSEAKRRYDEDIAKLISQENNLTKRINEISDYRNEKEAEKNEFFDRKSELSDKLTSLYISISGIGKDIETEKVLLATSDDRINSINAEIESAKTKIKEYEAKIDEYSAKKVENRKRAEEVEKLLESLDSGRSAKEESGFEFEKKIAEIRRKLKDKNAEKELVFRNHASDESKLEKLKEERDKLAAKLWDEYELTKSGAEELGYPKITAEERSEVYKKQTEYKNKLRALGSVNVGAIDEYAEVKTRYDYMTGQINDLKNAKTELLDVIGKLEKEMKTAFVSAFNAINEKFNTTFSELFGGGSAELLLTDEENVLISGIEIKAAPPGKIIKSLMQLSGGEQAFVAIALFFAILQVNPTPFCILDEIEAALDEVNVARFGEYIKRYSGGTQFILITHRRGTMEVADKLYGVTMPEHGISKVLALNVSEIKKTEGDDWDGIFRQA